MWRWCMAAGRSSDRLPWILMFIAIYQEIPRAYTKQALIILCQKRRRRRPVQPSLVNQPVIRLFLILRRLHTHESTLFYPQDVVISTKVFHNHLFQMRFYLCILRLSSQFFQKKSAVCWLSFSRNIFCTQPMVKQHISMIGSKHDDGIIQHLIFPESTDEQADLMVNVSTLGIVCTPGHGNLFPVVGLCLHLHFPHSKGIILPVSDEAFGLSEDRHGGTL